MAKKKPFSLFKDLMIDKKTFERFEKNIKAYRENPLTKNKNINLRVSTPTYLGLKKKAAKLGLPYQTLAGSILHQYASL